MRVIFLIAMLLVSPAFGQTSQPVMTPDATVAIGELRTELIDSFNAGDLPRLLSHLDPDVVITWQNGEVCRGPEQVRAYYDRMMNGANRVVTSVHSDPKVTDRHVYGDWAVSWGELNDHFILTDGSDLQMNSKFTATIVRHEGVWRVASFHLSVNAFDNSIMKLATRKTAMWVGGLALVGGLLVGLLAGRMSRRKRA